MNVLVSFELLVLDVRTIIFDVPLVDGNFGLGGPLFFGDRARNVRIIDEPLILAKSYL